MTMFASFRFACGGRDVHFCDTFAICAPHLNDRIPQYISHRGVVVLLNLALFFVLNEVVFLLKLGVFLFK